MSDFKNHLSLKKSNVKECFIMFHHWIWEVFTGTLPIKKQSCTLHTNLWWNPQSIRLSGAVSLQLVPVSLEELSLPLSSAPLLLPPCQQIQQLLHKSSQMRLHDSRQTIRDNILPLIGMFPSLFSGELSAGSIFFFF